MSGTSTGTPGRRQVLYLAKLFPWPLTSGARQRVFHLVRAIAERHDVRMIVHDAAPSRDVVDAFRGLVLLGDRDRRVRLAATRRAHVARRFDWASITAGAVELVSRVAGSSADAT